jgi:hypothetical protein
MPRVLLVVPNVFCVKGFGRRFSPTPNLKFVAA